MRHTDAVLLDGLEDNQMYQIPVDDAGMGIGTLEQAFRRSWPKRHGNFADFHRTYLRMLIQDIRAARADLGLPGGWK